MIDVMKSFLLSVVLLIVVKGIYWHVLWSVFLLSVILLILILLSVFLLIVVLMSVILLILVLLVFLLIVILMSVIVQKFIQPSVVLVNVVAPDKELKNIHLKRLSNLQFHTSYYYNKLFKLTCTWLLLLWGLFLAFKSTFILEIISVLIG
jgi:hypothetical protein